MIDIVSLDLERQDIINAYRFKLDKELDVYIAKLNKKRDKEISCFANRHSEEETSIYKKNRVIFYQDCIEHKKARLEKKYINKVNSLQIKVSQELLQEKADTKIKRLNEKLADRLCLKKERLANKNKKKIDKFLSTHNEEEAKQYRIQLEDIANKKIEKISIRNQKLISLYQKHCQKQIEHKLKSSTRVFEIDLLRGIAIWGMVIDHIMWDFAYLFKNLVSNYNLEGGFLPSLSEFAHWYWTADFRIGIRLFGVFLFAFLCGVSAKFSKNNLKRGLELYLFGTLITIALYVVSLITKDKSYQLLMSTISTLGLCVIIYSLSMMAFKKLFGDKKWKYICLIIGMSILLMWLFVSSYNYLTLDLKTHTFSKLVERLFFVFNNNGGDIMWTNGGYSSLTPLKTFKVIIGLEGFGSDWLGLFPYVGYTFLGGFVGETLYADNRSILKYFYYKKDRYLNNNDYVRSPQGQLNAYLNLKLSCISYPGRHTLLVYVLHQPIFILLFIPILLISGYQINLSL